MCYLLQVVYVLYMAQSVNVILFKLSRHQQCTTLHMRIRGFLAELKAADGRNSWGPEATCIRWVTERKSKGISST